MKNIAILGSTGSIGTQTLDIVRNNKDIKVVGLSAGSNIKLLEEQIREFRPEIVCVSSLSDAKILAIAVADLEVKVVSGMEGLVDIAEYNNYEILVTAIVGMIGLVPTVAAIKCGKDIALANKETLVTAGHIIMPLAKKMGVSILPVDSEHSAIFQSMKGEAHKEIKKILLTASGGPFRNMSKADLEYVTLSDALKHPNWSMGKKITIDSATMVNKGLEVIEAKWLFDVDFDDIEVVIQPQSIIHSMVEYIDGGVIAQLGTPDMRLPIQYALYYPERRFLPGDRLDFSKITSIEFRKPDMDTFKGLSLAYKVGRLGGSAPTVFNAANEYAVARFLENKIKFLTIYEIIETCVNEHKIINDPSIEDILNTEKWVYELIEGRWNI